MDLVEILSKNDMRKIISEPARTRGFSKEPFSLIFLISTSVDELKFHKESIGSAWLRFSESLKIIFANLPTIEKRYILLLLGASRFSRDFE